MLHPGGYSHIKSRDMFFLEYWAEKSQCQFMSCFRAVTTQWLEKIQATPPKNVTSQFPTSILPTFYLGDPLGLHLPMSVQLDGSSLASNLRSLSLSKSLSAEWAYRQAGVACVARAVDMKPVDIPAFSANARIDITLLRSFIVWQ